MTPATALHGAGAALRMARVAAGGRLVRVALLVGGLFVLGVLCGERASAADGTPDARPLLTAVTQHVVRPLTEQAAGPVDDTAVQPVTDSLPRRASDPDSPAVTDPGSRPVTDPGSRPVTEHLVRPVTEHVVRPVTGHAVRPVTDRAVRPVTGQVVRPGAGRTVESVVEGVVRPVTESVVRPVTEGVIGPVTEGVVVPVTEGVVVPVTEGVVVPVGDLVESVTEGLDGVTSQLPPGSLPSLPGVPGLPQSPGLPQLPEWTTLPVESLPVGAVPQESGPTEAERPGPASEGADGRDVGRATGPASVAYGPKAEVGGTAGVRAPHRTVADVDAGGAPGVRVPAQQNPDGLPTGTLGRHSAVDNGGPRHAEPHAVAALPPAPLSLVPGAPAADAADGTRDRQRDIPEFPG
ncbi:hypothetical protein RM704_23760 [Streptomyces sp. DSM 3412]|uniref:Uncharacterized protein n=1 Tax=Streptomyces gottesmaniae TaxID=3075518 RepID=A0ABU2Z1J1_9ACTN|nr:hypothetical protein [Streptomyces sp. DSM 3412]MDT0570445.1 hypothetical protein [Streptomyces sp. DSM 3412]